MKKEDRAILYGLSIGDGHISSRVRYKDGKYYYKTGELQLSHGPNQKEYLEHKADLVHSILGGKKPHIRCNNHFNKNGKQYQTYSFSKSNNYFKQIHSNLYKYNNKKKINSQVLSYLDEQSLAIWYMDDGSTRYNKNKQGEITSLGFEISTYCDDESEAQLICNWLKDRFDIDTRICLSKEKYNIRSGTKGTLSLCKIIEPYVIPCMMYKIAPSFHFVFRKSAKHPKFNLEMGDDIV